MDAMDSMEFKSFHGIPIGSLKQFANLRTVRKLNLSQMLKLLKYEQGQAGFNKIWFANILPHPNQQSCLQVL